MKKYLAGLALASSVLALGFSNTSQASMIFGVDTGLNTAPVHSGWTAMQGTNPETSPQVAPGSWTDTLTIGSYTAALNVNHGSITNNGWRNRNGPVPTAGSLSDMYQGLVFAATSIDLTVTGLTVGTQYTFIIYSWDSEGGNNGNVHWNYSLNGDRTSPIDAGYIDQIGSTTFTPTPETDLTAAGAGIAELSTTFTATGTSVNFFSSVGTSVVTAVNGFELDSTAAVPEPASLSLLGLAGLALLGRRRLA